MKEFISLRKSENSSIHGTIKVRQKIDTTQTCVDGKSAYVVERPPDSFFKVSKVADIDFFPNIRKLLLIRAIFPTSFSDTERAASGIRRP